MFRHRVQHALVIAGITVSGLLGAPAQAGEIQQPAMVALPSPLACATPWANVIVGTELDDEIRGTDGNDLIIGLGGDDTISGGGGRDTILGGDGDDVLSGGPADDCIIGGPGADQSVLWAVTVPNGNDDSYSVAFRYEY